MKKLIVIMISIAVLLSLPAVGKTAFPDRNITLIVTFSPGGGFDAIARAVGRSMKKFLPKGVH